MINLLSYCRFFLKKSLSKIKYSQLTSKALVLCTLFSVIFCATLILTFKEYEPIINKIHHNQEINTASSQTLENLILEINQVHSLQHQYVLQKNDSLIHQRTAIWENKINPTFRKLTTLSKKWMNKENKSLLEEIKQALDRFNHSQKSIDNAILHFKQTQQAHDNQSYVIKMQSSLNQNAIPSYNQLIKMAELLKLNIHKDTEIISNENIFKFNQYKFFLIGIFTLTLISILGIIYFASSFKKAIYQSANQIRSITSRSNPNFLSPKEKDFKPLVEASSQLTQQWKAAIEMVKNLAKDHNHVTKPISINNDMGDSLNLLKRKITNMADNERKLHWINQVQTSILELISSPSKDIHSFFDNLNSILVTGFNAGQSYIFTPSQSDMKDMRLQSCFINGTKREVELHSSKNHQWFIKAINEKEIVYLYHISPEHLRCKNETTNLTRQGLIIIPLNIGNDIKGIIEIVTGLKIDAKELEIIDKIRKATANYIHRMEQEQHSNYLLKSLQKHVEQLCMQEKKAKEEIHCLKKLIHKKERSLQKGKVKQRILQERMLVLELDEKQNILSANKTFYKITGYQAEQIIGKPLSTIASLKNVRMKNEKSTCQKKDFQMKITNPKGEQIWINATISNKSRFNQSNRLVLTGFNISTYNTVIANLKTQNKIIKKNDSSSKRLLDELTQNYTREKENHEKVKEELKSFQNETMWFETDKHHNLVTASQSFLNHLEIKELNKIKGKKWTSLLANPTKFKNEFPESQEAILLEIQGKQHYYFKCKIQNLNLQEKKVNRFSLIDLTEEKKQIDYYALQIEELKTQEQLLNQNLDELSAMQSQLHDSQKVLISQLESIYQTMAKAEIDLNGKCLSITPKFHELFGFNEEEIKNKNLSIIFSNKLKNTQPLPYILKKIKNGKAVSGTFKQINKSGSEFESFGFFIPIKKHDGEVIKTIFLAQNIKHHKQIEFVKEDIRFLNSREKLIKQHSEKIKILIVEDESLIAIRTKEILKSEGYSDIQICNSGEDAIILSMQYKPDVVLMDYSLKGQLNGLDAGIEIRKLLDIPVIFITAFARSIENQSKGMKKSYFLDKPVEKDQLLSLINTAHAN
jgi:two-component system, response regulator PdtaR